MEILYTNEFVSCVRDAKRSGGQAATGIDKATRALGEVELGLDPLKGMKTSNNRDDRLKGLKKYHPHPNYRLCTVQNGDHCIFVYYGKHDDVDRWLDRNRGRTFSLDDVTKKLSSAKKTTIVAEAVAQARPIGAKTQISRGLLWEKFPEKKWDVLVDPFPPSYVRSLVNLEANPDTDEILKVCGNLEEFEKANPDRVENKEYSASSTIFDILMALNIGDLESASASFDNYAEQSEEFTELNEGELESIQDSGSVKRLVPGSYEFDLLLNSSLEATNLEWLLFTHPDQDHFVKTDYAGSAILQGVSGSGKTGILVKRAARLAENDKANILIVTLNDSLSLVLADLVKLAVPDEDAYDRITVLSYFQLCQRLLREADPQNAQSYTRVTDITGQHSDEIFREFYRCETNNRSAEVLLPLHRSLSGRGVDAEKYINDEFDWIRSGVAPDHLDDYLSVNRKGRKLPLSQEYRQQVLDGLVGWKDKMAAVGVLDDAEITHKIYGHLGNLMPQYTNILIDEAQDLGTLELMTLRKLVPSGLNDVFLACDIAQTILPKKNDIIQAGFSFGDRVFKLQKNYRNSREILALAREILWSSIDDAFIDESGIEYLEPEFANRTGDLPLIMEADSLGSELAGAKEYCQHYIKNNDKSANCCIILSGYSNLEVKNFGKEIGIPTLDARANYSDELITLSDMETVKGLEFDVVFIVNCNATNLPPETHAEEEAFRDGCRLYVAMTRAKHRLILSYSGEISPWLETLIEPHDKVTAEMYFDLENLQHLPEPKHLAEVTDADEHSDNPVLDLSGDRFEYTSYARSVSPDVLEWFVRKVNGKSEYNKTGERHRTSWENMRQLLSDMRAKFSAGVGPTAFFSLQKDEAIFELFEMIEVNEGRNPSQKKNHIQFRKTVPKSKIVDRSKTKSPSGVDVSKVTIASLNGVDQQTRKLLAELKVHNVGQLLSLNKGELRSNPSFGRRRLGLLDAIPEMAKEYLKEKAALKEKPGLKKRKKAETKAKRNLTEKEMNVLWLLSNKPEIDDTGITKITDVGRTTINELRKLDLSKEKLVEPIVDETSLKREIDQSKQRRNNLAEKQRRHQDDQISDFMKYNPYEDK